MTYAEVDSSFVPEFVCCNGRGTIIAGEVGKLRPASEFRVGIIGASGRALSLIDSFAANQAVDVVTIADLDPAKLPAGLETAAKRQGRTPKSEADFRRVIDDSSLQAIVVGTPDHWHAIPTILACQSGKDVYVEKPDAHNIVEGMTMVAAMKKHGRVVQMGSQHRSTKRLQSAIEFARTESWAAAPWQKHGRVRTRKHRPSGGQQSSTGELTTTCGSARLASGHSM